MEGGKGKEKEGGKEGKREEDKKEATIIKMREIGLFTFTLRSEGKRREGTDLGTVPLA